MQDDCRYPSSANILDEMLQCCQKSSREHNNSTVSSDKNIFGEREKLHRLIVMDNVSGLADK